MLELLCFYLGGAVATFAGTVGTERDRAITAARWPWDAFMELFRN